MISFPPLPAFSWTEGTEDTRAKWRAYAAIPVTIDRADRPGVACPYAEIPAGFETDGASVPWFARWLFDPWGRVGLAAVLHDYLLTVLGLAKWDADLAFLHALRSQGVPAFQATLFYFAVRLRPAPPLNQRSPK